MATTHSSKQSGSIIDDVINQVTKLTKVGRETAADWVKTVSPDAADLIRPEHKSRTSSASTKRIIKVTGSNDKRAKKAATKKSPVKKAAGAVRSASAKTASPARTARKTAARPVKKTAKK